MTNDGTTGRLSHHYDGAVELGGNYPDFAFLECRRILEIVLKDFYLECTGSNTPSSVNTAEKIMQSLGEKGYPIPRVVRACSNLVQQLGNFGAHDQGGAEVEIDRLFIEPCLSSTKALIRWRRPGIILEKTITAQAAKQEAVQVAKQEHKTIRVRMREYVERNYAMGETFKMGELKAGFAQENPENSQNAVWGHICLMTTNLPSRLSHQPKKDGTDDLMYRVDKGIYRRFNADNDPEPIMPQKESLEWATKMLILNMAQSYDDVKNSRCYLSPDTGGNYKLHRAAYIGLYRDKSVRGIGEIIARVRVQDHSSVPEIAWTNDDELPKDMMREWVLEQIEQRWDRGYPVQALLIGEIHDCDFIKDTKGGMVRNNRVVDVSNVEHTTGYDLARSLYEMKWTELNH